MSSKEKRKKLGKLRIPVPPPDYELKDKRKYSRKEKHRKSYA